MGIFNKRKREAEAIEFKHEHVHMTQELEKVMWSASRKVNLGTRGLPYESFELFHTVSSPIQPGETREEANKRVLDLLESEMLEAFNERFGLGVGGLAK